MGYRGAETLASRQPAAVDPAGQISAVAGLLIV